MIVRTGQPKFFITWRPRTSITFFLIDTRRSHWRHWIRSYERKTNVGNMWLVFSLPRELVSITENEIFESFFPGISIFLEIAIGIVGAETTRLMWLAFGSSIGWSLSSLVMGDCSSVTKGDSLLSSSILFTVDSTWGSSLSSSMWPTTSSWSSLVCWASIVDVFGRSVWDADVTGVVEEA